MIDLGASSYYTILGLQPDADVRDIGLQQNLRAAELARRIANTRDPDERLRLEKQLTNLNQIVAELTNPVLRKDYDQKHSHLTFFVVRRAAAAVFEDPGLRHEWIHSAVRAFLSRRGERVSPITDLDRVDFTGDFTPNDLLDEWLGSTVEREARS